MSHYPVAEIRSVGLVVPDMDAAEAFYTTVWGLTIVDRASGVTFLRATGPDHHVLALHSGTAIEILSVTFRTSSAAELDEIARVVVEHGGVVVAAPDLTWLRMEAPSLSCAVQKVFCCALSMGIDCTFA